MPSRRVDSEKTAGYSLSAVLLEAPLLSVSASRARRLQACAMVNDQAA